MWIKVYWMKWWSELIILGDTCVLSLFTVILSVCMLCAVCCLIIICFCLLFYKYWTYVFQYYFHVFLFCIVVFYFVYSVFLFCFCNVLWIAIILYIALSCLVLCAVCGVQLVQLSICMCLCVDSAFRCVPVSISVYTQFHVTNSPPQFMSLSTHSFM